MNTTRRDLLGLVGVFGLLASIGAARAQPFPTRPVHWIVPFPAGGPSDILARLIGHTLTEQLRQPFVIENRVGAGGNIGTQAVATAPADGHTLLLVAAPNAINTALYEHSGFNFVRDIAPVASIARGPLIMLVAPSFPADTVEQFIDLAKASPGKFNMASAGNGTPPHVAGELFKTMTGIEMLHVPYRGVAPAVTDLLGGQVHVLFDPMPSSIGYVRAGKLRALAVTTAQRSELLPDTPSLAEFVPGYEASTWFGIGAPSATPADIVAKLNAATNAAIAEPAMKARLADLGASIFVSSPSEFKAFIAAEIEKWTQVVKAAGIKPA
ncbi:Bug family tripartite tricarboxylate transporter substrate binding protein [Bradyrhizobium sp.]|jgi:tripartite-type tricarboxylate transporter receptor subunit TctC|uniref:Bug family tripartite tricarboxylate transporter substrate binding protein n=1 Tax=Bradyrhizobium sp. TaxID=376 RepID=UPI003C5E980E